MRFPHPASVLRFTSAIAASVALSCVLIGCGGSGSSTPTPTPITGGSYSGPAFGGKAMVGSLPLIGAAVQLYTAGTSGNGSSGTALFTSAMTTDATGAFSFPAGYSCPLSTSQVYVVARGGKPGASATSANAAIVLMTAVGTCNQIVASSQIVVNEVTTVAAGYALSPFLTAGANVGATSTNTTGLGNAFATAQALANLSTGVSPGASFAVNGTPPVAKLDSLANLMNACAASAGTVCSSLFAATTPAAGSAPSNTLDALLNLTRNPGTNVAAIYTQSAASSAFSPGLAAAPSDWTLFVNYKGGGMNGPSGLGVDSAGKVWVASYFNVASLFSPLGVPLFASGITGGGLSASYGLAVDANDHAWIPNQPGPGVAGNSVSVFNSSGQSVAGASGYTGAGLYYPTSVAIDTDGSAWVVNYGNSRVSHLSGTGQALSGTTGYTSAYYEFPVAGAIDGNHNFWVANQSGNSVTRVSPDGSLFTNYVCCNGSSGLAIDQKGNVWAANYQGNSVSEVPATSSIPAPFTSPSMNRPQNVAIDGAGNVWITNYRGNSVTELAGASATTPGAPLSPAVGWGVDAGLVEGYPIAVDASGNVWVASFANNILTEFIGTATPVKTPLIALPVAP